MKSPELIEAEVIEGSNVAWLKTLRQFRQCPTLEKSLSRMSAADVELLRCVFNIGFADGVIWRDGRKG